MTTKPVVEIVGDVLSAEFCETLNMRPAAEQVIEALDAAGYTIVPKEPTMAMLAAGQDAWLKDPARLSSTLYRAMVAAAGDQP